MNINDFAVKLKELSQKPIFLKCAVVAGVFVYILKQARSFVSLFEHI